MGKIIKKPMEITDDKLLRIALITALIGLIGLIIFTPTIEVKKVKLSEITRAMIDEEVSVECVVTDISSSKSKSSYFLTLTDGKSSMTLIIFESQYAQIQSNNIDIGDFKNRKVNVVGKVTEYKSDLELILSDGDDLKIIS